MTGAKVDDGTPPPPDDDERDEPEGDEHHDQAGGQLSGEMDMGFKDFHFKASFRSWLVIAGVVAFGFMTALAKFLQAVMEFLSHTGHDRK